MHPILANSPQFLPEKQSTKAILRRPKTLLASNGGIIPTLRNGMPNLLLGGDHAAITLPSFCHLQDPKNLIKPQQKTHEGKYITNIKNPAAPF